ncbi:N/A [soil metagenome]
MTATNPKRILAIKLADLGDVLITEPALRSLRTAFPHARLDLLTTPAAATLVPLLGDSYNVIIFKKHDFDNPRALLHPKAALHLAGFGHSLRGARYDAVAIFHHLTTPAGALKFRALARATGAASIAGLDNGRGDFLTHAAVDKGFGARHEVDYMLDIARQLGGIDVDCRPVLSCLRHGERNHAFDLPERYAAIFPTTGPFAPGRNWPAPLFAAVANLLKDAALQPVILGAADATDAAQTILSGNPSAIDLTGQTTLPQLVEIVRNACVAISGDSFPGHLANAVDCPVVSIFGPSNYRAWAPYGATTVNCNEVGRAVIVRNHVPCSPCLYTGYRLGRRNGCPVRTCLLTITPEDVMAAIKVVTRGKL